MAWNVMHLRNIFGYIFGRLLGVWHGVREHFFRLVGNAILVVGRSVNQSFCPSVRPYIQLKIKLLKYSTGIPVVNIL